MASKAESHGGEATEAPGQKGREGELDRALEQANAAVADSEADSLAHGQPAAIAETELEDLHVEEALRDAARDALGVLDYTAQQVRTARDVLAGIDSPILGGMGVLLAVAGALGMWIVVSHPFRDWYMHLAVYVVLGLFWLLYVKAHVRRRRVRAALFGCVLCVLMGLWGLALLDMSQERRVWHGGEVIVRPSIPELVWPVVGLALVAIGMLGHYVGTTVYWRRMRHR